MEQTARASFVMGSLSRKPAGNSAARTCRITDMDNFVEGKPGGADQRTGNRANVKETQRLQRLESGRNGTHEHENANSQASAYSRGPIHAGRLNVASGGLVGSS